MLKVENIRAKYGDLEVLHDISFEVRQGEVLTIVGSNGAGKTTLMKTIAGLIKPAAGTIEFKGQRIDELPAHKVAELEIAYVPEGRRLFGRLSVLDNLLVGSYIPRARKRRQENLEYVLNLFPVLAERKNQRAGTLSGGEQQMLAIARGLMASPDILMLDEPSLGIAPIIVEQIFKIIRQLKEEGMTIVLVEQNVREALEVADRGLVIQTGRIVMEGSSSELLGSEAVKKAYLGM